MKLIVAALLLALVSTGHGQTAQTQVFLESSAATLRNEADAVLSGGTIADGDGTVLQLGYFSAATAGNNFLGTWVPLSGEGSLNTATVTGSSISYNQTSIGDLNAEGGANGMFFFELLFTNSGTNGQSLPTVAQDDVVPLAIRFYNAVTLGASTYYNTVSSDSWIWTAPSASPGNSVTVSLSDTLEWESIAVYGQPLSSDFQTTILIPEPGSAVLALSGLLMVFGRRTRR